MYCMYSAGHVEKEVTELYGRLIGQTIMTLTGLDIEAICSGRQIIGEQRQSGPTYCR